MNLKFLRGPDSVDGSERNKIIKRKKYKFRVKNLFFVYNLTNNFSLRDKSKLSKTFGIIEIFL